jgi:aspartate/methionine/tyrosine aminotransferase
MTGWRVGWMIAPRKLGQVVENLVQYNTSGTTTFLQKGCVAALDKGETFVAEQVEQARRGRDIVCNALAGCPNVSFALPEGAFYLFFKIEGENDSATLTRRLIDEAKVGCAPGFAFGGRETGLFACALRAVPSSFRLRRSVSSPGCRAGLKDGGPRLSRHRGRRTRRARRPCRRSRRARR